VFFFVCLFVFRGKERIAAEPAKSKAARPKSKQARIAQVKSAVHSRFYATGGQIRLNFLEKTKMSVCTGHSFFSSAFVRIRTDATRKTQQTKTEKAGKKLMTMEKKFLHDKEENNRRWTVVLRSKRGKAGRRGGRPLNSFKTESHLSYDLPCFFAPLSDHVLGPPSLTFFRSHHTLRFFFRWHEPDEIG
jgi:hypothetical protein